MHTSGAQPVMLKVTVVDVKEYFEFTPGTYAAATSCQHARAAKWHILDLNPHNDSGHGQEIPKLPSPSPPKLRQTDSYASGINESYLQIQNRTSRKCIKIID